ncbi:FimB/Mfa2 family fimbrial subunit [Bacteroides reticulotermitis]|uniref:FimB/Mfa2 family fimbrial subunit n=1 Tax=Bacteroides reticulotermitis TaxID=1133319 RepID=UPI003A88E5F3
MRLLNNIAKMLSRMSLCLILSLFVGCVDDEQPTNPETNERAIISLSLQAASSSINDDQSSWEDRVDELRMIVFDANSGNVVFNQRLYFPNGFKNKSKGVSLPTGTFDFYFFANETAYDQTFGTALTSLTNVSDFKTDKRFSSLSYNPDFLPDGSTSSGRFLMSAIYNQVTIASGGTEASPLPLNIPTSKVELIRALAKVQVIFRKKVPGSEIPANTITSVKLKNVASDYSVPPVDNYYTGSRRDSKTAGLTRLSYDRDSLGTVQFYIPEFLTQDDDAAHTLLSINNKEYPVESDMSHTGILLQRRIVPSISHYSVIRNYHYIINAYINSEGGIQLKVNIQPWHKDEYKYIFQDDKEIVIPPVTPTDSSLIIPTECGKIEMLNYNEVLPKGLQGAYNDEVNYYDPQVGGPIIYKGNPPYYCEKKYGKGWRLINSCELMSFLALFDKTYRIWASNTNEGINDKLPLYPLRLRQDAQALLEKLSGVDLSQYVLTDNGVDPMNDDKLDIIDKYFTPGDIMIKEEDFSGGWPYDAPPMNNGEKWFYSEVVIQVRGFWYPGYYDLSVPGNKEKVLYGEFQRYDYYSTVSRCVRVVQ